MRLSARLLSAAVIFILAASTFPAHADSYVIYDLGTGYMRDLLGIAPDGAVEIVAPGGVCGNQYVRCYEIWINGDLVSGSTAGPNLIYDNGTKGALTDLDGYTLTTVYNNGHEVWGTDFLFPAPYTNEIFDGPDPSTDFVTYGNFDYADFNSSGDFAYVAGIDPDGPTQDGEIYEAIDITPSSVPEPSSIALLGTGILGLAGVARRKFLRT
jgi:PEP-CTERM motif